MPRPSKIAVTFALAAGGIAAYWALTDDGMRPLADIAAVSDNPARVMPTERGSAIPEATATPRAPLPVAQSPKLQSVAQRTDDSVSSQKQIVREVRRHLTRVGCLAGPPSDAWDEAATTAARAFGEHINATIPVNAADHVLLTLLEGYRGLACNLVCPQGERADGDGICRPAVVAVAQPPVRPVTPTATAAPEKPTIALPPRKPANIETPAKSTEAVTKTQAPPPQPVAAMPAKSAMTSTTKPAPNMPAKPTLALPAKPAATTPPRPPSDRVARAAPPKPPATQAESSSRKPREDDRVAESRYLLQPSPIARPALAPNY